MNAQEQLKWAIEKWTEAANSGGPSEYVASCWRTIKSLRLEMETGLPHCNCHFTPWDSCPSRIKVTV